MAGLPVVGVNLDYDADLERIKDFLSTAKPARRAANGNGAAAQMDDDEEDAEDDEGDLEDAAADMYHLGLNGGQGRATGLKYKDAMQRIANRDQDKLVIDLEDVANVGGSTYARELEAKEGPLTVRRWYRAGLKHRPGLS
jgi:DNA replication licensing factor MCM7